MTETNQEETQSPLELVNREGFLPDKIREAYKNLPEELRYLTESELRGRYRYTVIDERLRVAFWREVGKSINSGKQFYAKRVFTNICSEPYFYNKFIKNTLKVAWMMQPMVPYESATNALLNMAVGRYEEIISMDITTIKKTVVGVGDDGKPIYEYLPQIDPSKAGILVNVIGKIEDRVKGMATQKTISINDSAPKDGDVVAMNMDAVDERLKELRLKLDTIDPTSKPIEVECEVVNE